jgi:hypothetical protein
MSDKPRTPDEGSGKPDPSHFNAWIRRQAGRPVDESDEDEAPCKVSTDAGAGGKGNDPPEDFNAALRRAAGFPPW